MLISFFPAKMTNTNLPTTYFEEEQYFQEGNFFTSPALDVRDLSDLSELPHSPPLSQEEYINFEKNPCPEEFYDLPLQQVTGLFSECEECAAYYNTICLYSCPNCFTLLCDDCAYKDKPIDSDEGWRIIFDGKDCPNCHQAKLQLSGPFIDKYA